jgi:hypothetical protein
MKFKLKNNFWLISLIIFLIIIIIGLFNYFNYLKSKTTKYKNLLLEKFEGLEMNDDNIKTNIDPNNDFPDILKKKKNSSNNNIIKESKKSTKKLNSTIKFDSQYAKNSFCQLDNSKTKCVCKFQKDDIKAAFNSPQINCDKICASIKAKDCLQNNEFTEIPYYCNIAGKCIKYKGTVVSSHISANNCGTEQLTNQLLLPFLTLEECEKSLDPCNKYNDIKKSVHLNRTECLGNPNCGFCTNSNGEGKCISGNATGPSDLNKYYYCNPYSGNKNNTYEYGNRAEYILQNY